MKDIIATLAAGAVVLGVFILDIFMRALPYIILGSVIYWLIKG